MSDDWGILSELPFTPSEIKQLTKMPRVVEYIQDITSENRELLKLNINFKKKKSRREVKCIAQIDPEKKEVVSIYRTIAEAARAMGVSHRMIFYCLEDKRKRCKGFAWTKIDDWGICTKCGFSGKRSENFPINKVLEDGHKLYKPTCRQCTQTARKQAHLKWKEKKCTK